MMSRMQLMLGAAIVAFSSGQMLTWREDACGYIFRQLPVPGEADAFYVAGSGSTGNPCAQKWVVGAKAPAWSFNYAKAQGCIESIVAAPNGDLFVGTRLSGIDTGLVARLSSANGTELWSSLRRYPTGDGSGSQVLGLTPSGTSIAIVDTAWTAYGYLTWLNASSGQQISSFKTNVSPVRVNFGVSYDASLVFLQVDDVNLAAFGAVSAFQNDPNGKTEALWTTAPQYGQGFILPVAAGSDAINVGGCLYMGCFDTNCTVGSSLISCSGQTVWSVPLNVLDPPSSARYLGQSSKYFAHVSDASGVEACATRTTLREPTTGKLLWSTVGELVKSCYSGFVTVTSDAVYVESNDGPVYINHEWVARYTLNGTLVWDTLVSPLGDEWNGIGRGLNIVNSTTVFGTGGPYVFAIQQN